MRPGLNYPIVTHGLCHRRHGGYLSHWNPNLFQLDAYRSAAAGAGPSSYFKITESTPACWSLATISRPMRRLFSKGLPFPVVDSNSSCSFPTRGL